METPICWLQLNELPEINSFVKKGTKNKLRANFTYLWVILDNSEISVPVVSSSKLRNCVVMTRQIAISHFNSHLLYFKFRHHWYVVSSFMFLCSPCVCVYLFVFLNLRMFEVHHVEHIVKFLDQS